MKTPKLQAVGSDLARVESANKQQQNSTEPSPTTNLERTIYANQMIVHAIDTYIQHYLDTDGEMKFVLQQKVQELEETLGEQELSLQLLRLLSETNGNKRQAANEIEEWLNERNK